MSLLNNKRVGVIANHTSVNSQDKHLVDILIDQKVDLVRIFSPEHGFLGKRSAGENIENDVDSNHGIEIISLYGKNKSPQAVDLQDLDILIFDIQDIGVRYYTYVSTMTLAMEKASQNNLQFIVLDRPNPIGGNIVQGSVLDLDFSSFVGMHPIPVRHGMTIGEIALFIKRNGLIEGSKNLDLKVIKVHGWNRDEWDINYDKNWISPSPNIKDKKTALMYLGTCLLEGTNVSEGRGTDSPFMLLGSPWLNSEHIAFRLNNLNLEGVSFSQRKYTPSKSKYSGIECNGIQIHISDYLKVNPFIVGVQIISEIYKNHKEDFKFNSDFFDKLYGGVDLRIAINESHDLNQLFYSNTIDLENFKIKREHSLIYPIKKQISLIDMLIIIIYILIIFCIGFFLKNRVNTFNDFMIANSNIGIGLGVASMAGTELGLITVMYNAQQGWSGYFASFHIGFIAFIITLCIGFSGFVITKLRNLNVKSIPEFYGLRYGKEVQILGAFFLVIGGILNMGLFLKVGGIFLQAIFGDIGIGLHLIMFFLLVLVLMYTLLGGMLSVIITDYIQFVMLSLGLLISTFLAIYYVGWNNIFSHLEKGIGEPAFNPVINTSFGYDYILWMIILAFVSCVIWPTATTRALAMKDSESVKKQYMWSSISFMIRFMVPSFLGICAFVYFRGDIVLTSGFGADTSLGGMPSFLREILPIGVVGLVIAAMLSAFMSTHDSYLLCWSTIITNDIITPLKKGKISSDKKITISRIIIVLLGFYILYWGIFYKGSDDIWGYLAITGSVYFSGAISLVVLGLYSSIVNKYGAYCSLFCGLISLIGLSPIKNYLEIDISSSLIGIIVVFLSIAVMYIGSFFGPLLFTGRSK
ncbi:MAG: hypothetical protein CMG00_07395 [Candidatus Marinimicrobia bacterium]|nr:hypothetical protein [Candidatus Neomarinimicrobiota bacterium]